MADGPDKLSIVVFDGRFERVHYALAMASAAAATSRAVTLFFTGKALTALTPGGWCHLYGDPARANAGFRKAGVADFEALLEACRDFGVRFIACEMGLRAAGLAEADLDADLRIEIAGIVTFLGDSSKSGAMLFI